MHSINAKTYPIKVKEHSIDAEAYPEYVLMHSINAIMLR